MIKRRKFLAAAAVIAAGSVGCANAVNSEDKLIAHQVYFWLKNAGSTEDRTKLIDGIRTLKKIKSVTELQVGIVAATEKRDVIDDTWSVSLLVMTKDVAGQDAYQIDPIHLDFVKNYSALWSKVVIYDSQLV